MTYILIYRTKYYVKILQITYIENTVRQVIWSSKFLKKSYNFMNFKYDVAKGLKISKDNQG